MVEEIFGGSPWVIFSHALTAYAKGVDLKITSEASPSSVKYGLDSIWIKHTIEDINEPNVFDEKFDPYHVSVGYTTSAITSLAGGKDPCSLVDPAISTSTLIDPKVDKVTITLVPGAGTVVKNNPDLDGFPKSVSGIFLQVKVEVMNGTDDNWINTAVTPVLSGLGNTKAVLTYVAYPRPLVPAHIDNGVITPGDQPGTFTTGWRFNQPEGEVLVKMGNTLNLMQPTRRGYFIFLFSIDESLKSGIYDIGFTLSGTKKHYTGQDNGNVSYAIPSVKFSIIEKSDKYHVKEYQKIKIDNATLTNLTVNGSNYFQGLNKVKWSAQDVNFSNFDGLTTTLQTALSDSNRVEVIDLSKVKNLPNADTSKLYILEKVKVNSYRAGENIDLTTGEKLYYSHNPDVNPSVPGNKIVVSPYGPRILISQTLYSVNDVLVGSNVEIPSDQEVHIATRLNILNAGTDVSTNTKVSFYTGSFYTVIADKLPKNATFDNGLITVNIERPLVPGDTSSVLIYYTLNQTVTTKEDLMTVINLSNISYQGTSVNSIIKYSDPSKVLFSMYDFQLKSLEYTKISDTEYEIKVLAINRGLPASNIWLRLYPAIGGGISELPIAEKKIASFATGQEVELDYIYTLHNSELVQMYAKIDDGDLIAEAIEKNNSLIKDITSTVGLNELKSSISFKAYPNPFSDHVCFSYNLKSDVDDINLSVYTASGVEVIRFINCPVKDGNNSIDWYPVNLASGNYIYKLIVANKSGKSSVIPGLLIKTER